MFLQKVVPHISYNIIHTLIWVRIWIGDHWNLIQTYWDRVCKSQKNTCSTCSPCSTCSEWGSAWTLRKLVHLTFLFYMFSKCNKGVIRERIKTRNRNILRARKRVNTSIIMYPQMRNVPTTHVVGVFLFRTWPCDWQDSCWLPYIGNRAERQRNRRIVYVDSKPALTKLHTLWLCQNSFGTWPFRVICPIKNDDFP